MGLREEKKRITRKAISDLATRLFIERGYDSVTTAEIAKLTHVSVPTLFKYFPTKEALVFDEDQERESLFVDSVKARRKNQSICEALLEMGLRELDAMPGAHKKQVKAFLKLVNETPALKAFEEGMWLRHEKVLAATLKKESETKISQPQAEAVARFVLNSFHRSLAAPQPKSVLKELFEILGSGWTG